MHEVEEGAARHVVSCVQGILKRGEEASLFATAAGVSKAGLAHEKAMFDLLCNPNDHTGSMQVSLFTALERCFEEEAADAARVVRVWGKASHLDWGGSKTVQGHNITAVLHSCPTSSSANILLKSSSALNSYSWVR